MAKKGEGAAYRLKHKSRKAIDKMDKAEARSRKHPSTKKDQGEPRKKTQASSMAPREGGKKKHYGRPFGKKEA